MAVRAANICDRRDLIADISRACDRLSPAVIGKLSGNCRAAEGRTIRIPRGGFQVQGRAFELRGPRVTLRPLHPEDFEAWSEVRLASGEWLTKWEPMALSGYPDVARDRKAFVGRCGVRDREWQLGTGAGFGIFVNGTFAGELNVSNIQRGPFQNADVGYWIGERFAGFGYMPEAIVVLFRFVFEELGLHRLQISIIPRNGPSNRVAQKLGLRDEGVALRYLEINGNWEDHVRYGFTAEDWFERRSDLVQNWLNESV